MWGISWRAENGELNGNALAIVWGGGRFYQWMTVLCVWAVEELSPEAIDGEQFVRVVVLHNLAHCIYGCGVLVERVSWVEVVKRGLVRGVAWEEERQKSYTKRAFTTSFAH